jgi:hypothetical protein
MFTWIDSAQPYVVTNSATPSDNMYFFRSILTVEDGTEVL